MPKPLPTSAPSRPGAPPRTASPAEPGTLEAKPQRPLLARQLARFFALTLRQGHEDAILLTASALAFVTILSLVPLLAALSFIGTRVFDQAPDKSLEVFVQVLPYSESTVTDKLREFLGQAEGIHGFGLAALFITSLLAFATVEESINRIWNVSRRRPLRNRLLSFSLLLFWAPLLIGVSLSSLLLLRQAPALRQVIQGSVLLHVSPFVATVVGLTLLYWVVPFTKVRLRNAVAGGLLAGLLLELLRLGYGYYVELFSGVSTVYGSSAFALLFLISIELTWAIVLLGSEAAYTAQHFAILTRGLHDNPPVQASWVGLAAVSVLGRRRRRGGPPLAYDELAEQLSLPVRDLERTLHPLVQAGVLEEMRGREYLLSIDPAHLTVERVFDAFEHRARRGVEHAGPELRRSLDALIDTLAGARRDCLGRLSLADLLAQPAARKVPPPVAEVEGDAAVKDAAAPAAGVEQGGAPVATGRNGGAREP